MRKAIYFAALLLCSCSKSASFDEDVYDDVLSGTLWVQDYVENSGTGSGSSYYHNFPFLSDLRKEVTAVAHEHKDTIVHTTSNTGKLCLLFANTSCTLADTKTVSGTSYIRTCTRTEYHYADQTGAYQDGEMTYSYRVSNDTLYVICSYNDRTREGEQYMGRWNTDVNVQTTTPTAYERNNTAKETFSFSRSGTTVILTGDRMLMGTLNGNGDELKLDEYGTLYLEK